MISRIIAKPKALKPSRNAHLQITSARSGELVNFRFKKLWKIELSGSYVDIRRVLAALEQMPQALWIDQVSLKRAHENGKDVEVDLKLEVFAGNFNKSG